MDKEKKMSNYKKKTNLAQFTEIRRKTARNKARTTQSELAIKDGLNPTQRKQKKIDKAANGCWWIKQYIMGTLSYRQDLCGVDDE